jgi:HK97 family phage major capsid protein
MSKQKNPVEVVDALQQAKSDLLARLARENRNPNMTENDILDGIDQQIREWQAKPLASVTGLSGFTARSTSGPFLSLGEELQAVANASKPGQPVDQRLYQIRNQTGLNETTASEGGFLVQSDFNYSLLKGLYETNILSSKCNHFQISGNANSIKLPAVDETSRADGSRWGGIQSYWKAEGALKVASQPKFRQMELNLHKLIGLCYATDELLSDAAVLEKVVRQGFEDEIGFKVDDGIINGTGAGQPLGIMNSGALVTVDAQVGQDPDTVVTENLLDMYARMPARNRKNAAWYINQSIEPQLYAMSLAVGAGGGPVYMPSGNLSVQPYATLFGRPVIAIEQASPLGDLGDILFADMSQYILADKGGISSDMSIHVNFLYDESVNAADDYQLKMAA